MAKTENKSLKQTVAELTQEYQFEGSSVSSGLSEVALAILDVYRKRIQQAGRKQLFHWFSRFKLKLVTN
jgi:hypothetical protein